MNWRSSGVSVLAAAVFVFLAAHASAYSVEQVGAVASNDFVVEPAKIEIFADPGDVITKSVTIVDRIEGRSTFSLSLEDFVGSDDASVAVKLLGDEVSRYSFRDNIIPEVKSLELEFGQKAVIPITIRVPETASPGGYYTSVVIATTPTDSSTGGNGAKTVSRVAQLLFVRVNGDVVEEGTLKDFVVSPTGFFHFKGPLTFNVLFENRGTVHLAPYGYITIKNLFGTTVDQIPVDAYYSLPQSQRYRQITWEQGAHFGYYTATLELNKGYRDSETIETKTTSFVFLPLSYLITLLIVIVLILLVRRYLRNNFELRRRKS